MYGIFLDTETTGLDPFLHRILEIAIKVVDLSQDRVINTYQSIVQQPQEVWDAADPISLEVNGFTHAKMLTGKNEKAVGEEIVAFLTQASITRKNAFFIAQNASFDRGFFCQVVNVYQQEKLEWPYHWLDLASMYWALEAYRHSSDNVSLSKDAIAKAHNIPKEQHPHHAMNGVNHLLACYRAIINSD